MATLKATLIFIAVFALLLFLLPHAHAQVFQGPTAINNIIDEIPKQFRDQAQQWESSLQGFAVSLFWLLATIQFVWAAIRLGLQRGDLDDWLTMLVQQILFVGFFFTLLMHSSEWAGAIVNSFREAANVASGAAGGIQGVSPSNFFDAGVEVVTSVLANFHFINDLIPLVCALLIMISFALIGAFLIAALVESYIVISAGVLFMGFGGSGFTSEYAIRIINYAVSVGAKLFILQLLIGLGQSLFTQWLGQLEASNYSIEMLIIMVGASIVFLTLTKTIPDLVQALINGASFSSGWAMISTANMITGAVTSAVGAGGGYIAGGFGGAVAGAVGSTALAREQMLSEGQQPFSKENITTTAWRSAQNFGKSALLDLGGRMSGRRLGGTMGSRMSYSNLKEAQDLREQRKKPSPPEKLSGSSNLIRPESPSLK